MHAKFGDNASYRRAPYVMSVYVFLHFFKYNRPPPVKICNFFYFQIFKEVLLMLQSNAVLLNKHQEILSFRDLAETTVSTYTSYMTSYINWVEENLPARSLISVSWEEIRSYVKWLKDITMLTGLAGAGMVMKRKKRKMA